MALLEWTDIVVAVISTMGGVAIASVPIVLPIAIARRRREKQKKEESRKLLSDIHESTVNTHSTILREDVDSVIEKQDKLDGKLDHILDLLLEQNTQIRSINGKVTNHGKILRRHEQKLAELVSWKEAG